MTITDEKNLRFGNIVLLKFPFTDKQTFKRRPALVIQECNDGDIIVCRITSKIYDSDKDIFIDNWEKSGLKLRTKIPSALRSLLSISRFTY